jgi:hypothetical protein
LSILPASEAYQAEVYFKFVAWDENFSSGVGVPRHAAARQVGY